MNVFVSSDERGKRRARRDIYALLLLGAAAATAGIIISFRHKTQIMNLLDKTKLALVGRTINKIIVHCTATRPSQSCTVEQIDQWHRQRGFDSIGYHYVVYRDGSVHQGRPLSKAGAHCVGQNSDSIGISYCGGVAEDGQTPQDNRTPAQKASLIQLIKELRQAYGNIPVYGHRDFSSKACPSFDARKEYN